MHGFSFTRSFTHPCVAAHVGGLWVVRDAPRTNGQYRREEWVAHGVAPGEIDNIVRKHARGRFAICTFLDIGQDDQATRSTFKSLGYRFASTEPLMVHDLRRVPRRRSPATIQRVMTQAMADRVAAAEGSRQVLAEHLMPDAPLRQYVALVGDQVVGWVRSIATPSGTWCSNMRVLEQFRRRGIGAALLCRMLRDDRAGGAAAAVLTASHTGAKLYASVGYKQIATLYFFTPRRRG